MSADLLGLLMRLVLVVSAAIALVLALRIPMRAAFGARVAYALWLLVPIAAIAAVMPARLVLIDAAPLVSSAIVEQGAPTATVATPPADAMSSAATFAISRLDAYIIALWALGFAFSLAVLALGQHRFLRRLGARRAANGVRIAATDSAGPAVVGVFVPRIVVPVDFEARYTPAERELVLEHERAHIRAGDVQVNALAALLQCVFWFNPLAYVARAALRIDQELACDERVMQRHGSARRAYAEAMLKTQLAASAVPLGCAWPPVGAQPLKQRITALGRPRVAATRRAFGGALCLAATLVVALTAWVAQPPRRAYADEVQDGGWLQRSSSARLVHALQNGDVAEARDLIAAGADVNHWIPGDGTPLIMAARLNDLDMARDLLEAGADVDQVARGEGNALIVASQLGNVEMARLFVQAGADVNAIVPSDETPLINAARRNRLVVARYLINHGADVNLAVRAPIVDGNELRSPLQMARRGGHVEMIDLLRQAGARG
ncbi:M56 family metallopeptidase [Terricaulis silvestris]|uniref:Methicillin resistance mecR1 protein n=1 Tax=Terricaulis silvestris TaxID=2686094 RepID=A0A6I6MJS9_9CAUL|nr:M56 family metallopeptidase [Terricaulis silvestris]QGZ93326.1 Methicillin resistance mecR1 protein [Terricaulis silvestris]